MSAPVGNKFAKGKGRKGFYQEKADAEKLFDAFFGENDQEQIEAKIRTGKYSIWDRVVLTAMEGDTKILQSMINRIFPEKIEHSGNAIVPVIVKARRNRAS